MYMCNCMWVYVYVCVRMYVCTCMYTRTCVPLYTYNTWDSLIIFRTSTSQLQRCLDNQTGCLSIQRDMSVKDEMFQKCNPVLLSRLAVHFIAVRELNDCSAGQFQVEKVFHASIRVLKGRFTSNPQLCFILGNRFCMWLLGFFILNRTGSCYKSVHSGIRILQYSIHLTFSYPCHWWWISIVFLLMSRCLENVFFLPLMGYL